MPLKEKCPKCGEQLYLDRSCCEKRSKGILLLKRCHECGWEEDFLGV
jgi:predicted RNA-binding Zn-ribbon protein involved in translation (DUF1610 family)